MEYIRLLDFLQSPPFPGSQSATQDHSLELC